MMARAVAGFSFDLCRFHFEWPGTCGRLELRPETRDVCRHFFTQAKRTSERGQSEISFSLLLSQLTEPRRGATGTKTREFCTGGRVYSARDGSDGTPTRR